MDAAQLAREVKRAGLDVPVVVLAYDYREIKNFVARNPVTDIERMFLWQGNARILIAIVKYIEDKRNVLHDTRAIGVPVLLVVEDNIRYYSSFLPVIYTELIKQSRRVIQEGINVAHKLVRMQARPKILLSSNFEDAARLVQEYRDYLIGLVSDVEFPCGGELSPEAGFELARMVQAWFPTFPLSCKPAAPNFVRGRMPQGYSFLRKRSPTLLKDLRRILDRAIRIWRLCVSTARLERSGARQRHERTGRAAADGSRRKPRVSRAKQPLFALADGAHRVCAGGETASAKSFGLHRPRTSAARSDRIDQRIPPRTERSADWRFRADTFKPSESSFLRIGSGSLGGKARGLAFVRHLLRKSRMTPPLSRRAHLRPSSGCAGDGCVRSISGREQPA